MNKTTRQFRADHNIVSLLGVLVISCLILVILTGDIGFQGDDWAIFSWPYWNDYLTAVWNCAKEFRRPIEALYWITLYKLFGLNKPVFHFFSLLLLAVACLLMGGALLRAFPTKKDFAILSVFFSFVFPTLAPLTFLIHTDNSRLAQIFFWWSVVAFQKWVTHDRSWSALIAPITLYWLSCLTYENGAFLIFAVPLLVWPIYVRNRKKPSDITFFLGVYSVTIIAFVTFLFIRLTIFSGGAVPHRDLTPDLNLALSYFSVFGKYLTAPFSTLSSDYWAWAWGILIVSFAAIQLSLLTNSAYLYYEEPLPGQSFSYIAALCILIFVLGTLPYILAGYGADLGFTSQSRIYSSGSFGAAMLISLLATNWTQLAKRILGKAMGIAMLFFMAVFFSDLRNDWRQAAVVRGELCKNLLLQVPSVEPKTTFLFLNLQSYIGNRAVIFQGVDGLNEWIKMLYNNKQIDAYFLYPCESKNIGSEKKIADVTTQGIIPRGRLQTNPVPFDSILLFKKAGERLIFLNKISEIENAAAINWAGVTEIYSNKNRIKWDGEFSNPIRQRFCK